MDCLRYLRKGAARCAVVGSLGAVLLQTSCGQTGSTAETAKHSDTDKATAASGTVRYYSSVVKRPLTDTERQQIAEAVATYHASIAKTFGLTPEDLKAKEDAYRLGRRSGAGSAATAAGPMVGKPAPPWVIAANYWANTPAALTLPQLAGHVTLLEFGRLKCSHCADAAPFLKRLYEQYSPLGLKMVSFVAPAPPIDPAHAAADWEQAKANAREWKSPYPVAFDQNHALFSAYGCKMYPTMVVLDNAGVVRLVSTGQSASRDATVEQFIRGALKLPAPAAPQAAP